MHPLGAVHKSPIEILFGYHYSSMTCKQFLALLFNTLPHYPFLVPSYSCYSSDCSLLSPENHFGANKLSQLACCDAIQHGGLAAVSVVNDDSGYCVPCSTIIGITIPLYHSFVMLSFYVRKQV